MNDAGGAERGNDVRALLARVAQADERAFAELYRQASPQLYAIALRIVRRAALAEEIVQEAFVSIWHHAGTYDAAKSDPTTWLASIVRHRALDHLRRRDAEGAPGNDGDEPVAWEGVSDAPSPVELLLAGADARAIRDCVDALDAGPKQAVAVAFFHGLTHDELALHLAQPLPTVKSWLRRGLERLRHCLDGVMATR